MKTFYTFVLLCITLVSQAQQTVSGIVVDEKNQPIAGANIFIEGTYDGASSDEKGRFSFTTTATGNQVLVISFLTYETLKVTIDVANCQNKTFKLKESVNSLDAVIVTAGTFDAGEKARVSVL